MSCTRVRNSAERLEEIGPAEQEREENEFLLRAVLTRAPPATDDLAI